MTSEMCVCVWWGFRRSGVLLQTMSLESHPAMMLLMWRQVSLCCGLTAILLTLVGIHFHSLKTKYKYVTDAMVHVPQYLTMGQITLISCMSHHVSLMRNPPRWAVWHLAIEFVFNWNVWNILFLFFFFEICQEHWPSCKNSGGPPLGPHAHTRMRLPEESQDAPTGHTHAHTLLTHTRLVPSGE